MSAAIKLISLNIERAKHLDLVVPFLKEQQPDVACVQEIREPDIDKIRVALGTPFFVYRPMQFHPTEEKHVTIGVGIFSKAPLRGTVETYWGDPDKIPSGYDNPSLPSQDEIMAKRTRNVLACADIEFDDTVFRIMTTHFLWAAKGLANEYQREAMRKLLELLATKGEFVLTGDFNAPRGGEVFGTLAGKYKDNIPSKYKTSLDLTLHRAAQAGRASELSDKMVDGIFSTPGYVVSDVEMVCGVSDHCALVAKVTRVI